MLAGMLSGAAIGGMAGLLLGYLFRGGGWIGWVGLLLGAVVGAVARGRRTRAAKAAGGAWMSRSDDTMRLREEVPDIRKETVDAGEVTVRTEVVEEERTIRVPVRREEKVIERTRPGDPDGAAEVVARIPVKEERVTADTYTVRLEDVSVDKQRVEEMREISQPLERETASVETHRTKGAGGAESDG